MKVLSSSYLVFLLNLPTIVAFSHFHHNEHNHCEDQSLHYHQTELECTTCDYLRISLDNELYNNDLITGFFEKNHKYTVLYHTDNPQYFIELYNTRGPQQS